MSKRHSTTSYLRLLDPDALARIHRLELVARGVVEGFITGRHRSPYKGFSVEFAEHRQYAPGDNVADLDWRVYGKSDRYYVKQYVEETNLRATLLLDASGSMGYTGRKASTGADGRLGKFAYARMLAASLAHLMIHQQDAVGLMTHDSAVRRYIPARSRPGHLRILLHELAETAPGSETALADVYHDAAERVHRRGLIVVISDLLDDADALLKAFQHFRFRKHEVIVLHVLAEEELTFPFDQMSDFRDLEGAAARVRLDPQTIRAEYLDRLRRHIDNIRTGCGRMGIDYAQMPTSTPFDEALANYLARRRKK